MKEKLFVCGAIILFILIIGLLMMINDGLLGSEVEYTTGWVLLIGCVVFILVCIIFNIYYKFKK